MTNTVVQPRVPALDDRIRWIRLTSIRLPIAKPVSDAKVIAGRQAPLSAVDVLVTEIQAASGHEGFGYTYALRAGGAAQYVHAKEIAPLLLGEDSNDISRLWDKLLWAGASIGRSGLAPQAVAAFDVALWDMRAKRLGLSLAKLLGSYHSSVRCYNTSGGYLQASTEELLSSMEIAKTKGIGGIKMKIGHSDSNTDLKRVAAARDFLGEDFPLMVDANQRWDRPAAKRVGRALDQFNLTFLEEPLVADDVEGHAILMREIATPIATGEMLCSVADHARFIDFRAVDYLQPDVARVGGITPFLRIMALADQQKVQISPHFLMEIHLHLVAAHPGESWIEHFEWFEPLFNERLAIEEGRILVPDRPGIGLSLSEEANAWKLQQAEVGQRG